MKFVDAFLRGVVSLCILTLAALGTFAQDSKTRSDLSRSFESFELVRVAQAQANENESVLNVRAAGRELRLRVEKNNLFSDRYRAEDTQAHGSFDLSRPEVNTYKGRIEGKEGASEVRLTIEDGKIVGFFDVDGERFFVEPAKRYSEHARVDQSVIYRDKDSFTQEPFYCHSDSLPNRIEEGIANVTAPTANVVLASRNMEIATDADFEYVTRFSGAAAANNEIVSILNMVEGTYATQLDLELSIVFQHTWSSADPFAGGDSGAILTAFRLHWISAYPTSSVPRDVAHLFSGKSNILSAGIAFVGAVCSSANAAYGVSGYVNWAPGKYLIPAHELGHNLGGEHAEVAQGCGNTIMNAFLSGSAQLTFCPFSRNQIGSYIANSGGCLTGGSGPLPTPTPTPFPTPTPVPTATPTPVPTPTPNPTPFPTATPTPFPTPTPGGTPFPCSRCPQPTPTPGSTPVPTPFPTPFPTPTPNPTPNPTPTPAPTPTPFPTPTATPVPTPSPTPFPTPRPRVPIFGAVIQGNEVDAERFDFGFGKGEDLNEAFAVVDISFWLGADAAPMPGQKAPRVASGIKAFINPLTNGDRLVLDPSVFRESD